jgi:Tfp pilus assembly protein PilN
MSHDVINFLPESSVRAFGRMYQARLASTVAVAVALLVVAHVALLTPTYLYIENEYMTRSAQLAMLAGEHAQEGQEALSARVGALAKNTERLDAFLGKPRVSTFVQALLTVPQTGVSLYALSIDVPTLDGVTMRVSGTASSREELRAYHLALSTLPFVSSADLPLSVYAKESDIPFSITLVGTLSP